jgi:hypothetical protein
MSLNYYFNLGRGKLGDNYMKRSFVLGCLMALGLALPTQATVYFDDHFEYADGQLTDKDNDPLTNPDTGANVSGGNWISHSGTAEFVQVAGEKAVVKTSGTEDVNRTTGTTMTAFGGETWYYSARFTVADLRSEGDISTLIGSNYFLHFKDNGTFNLTGRLYIAPPTDPLADKFTLGLSSYSVNGTGGTINRWGTDLDFDTEYTVVVSLKGRDNDAGTTDDGFTSLWVNPVNSSSSKITDTAPHPDMFLNSTDPVDLDLDRSNMSALAMRQTNAGNTQPDMLIDAVAVGNDFDQVLAAVAAPPTGIPGDFDDDDDVDGRDFLLWQRGLSTTAPLDAGDLQDWQDNYGTGTGGPLTAVTAVPEPTSLAMLALALVPMACGRKR